MRLSWLAALIPLAFSAAPAFALDQLDIQHCQQQGDAELTIDGCGKIVGDKSVDTHDRAVASFFLGIGYYAKNDLDNAIKAWTEATALEPAYVHAYNNLGKAYLAKTDYAKAIDAYGQAIKLDPKHAVSYKGRGIAQFLSGAKEKAQADFQQAVTLDPGDSYSQLWLELTKRRLGAKASPNLAKASTQLNMAAWPAPLLLLYEGQMTPHDVIMAAQHVDIKVSKARMCDVGFYAGELSLSQGDKSEAIELFHHATDVCFNSVDEKTAAVAELKALGQNP
ncbi:MAG: tetratricopeptide repeat protein [Pseudomonadota bacterium]